MSGSKGKKAFLTAAGCLLGWLIAVRASGTAALQPVYAESSLIDASRMKASQTNYRTEEVRLGELVQSFSMGAMEVFPLSRRAILTDELVSGHTAVHKETLVRVGDVVEAGDPVEEIEVLVDEVDLAEKELRLTRLTERYEAGLASRREAYDSLAASLGVNAGALEEKLSSGAELDSLSLPELKLALAKLELEKYILENEHEIDGLSKEVEALNALHEVRYITAPISGKVADIHIYHPGDRIQPGEAVCSVLDENVMLVMGENTGLRTGMRVTVETGQGNRRVSMTGTVVAAPDTSPVIPPDRGYIALDPGERDPNLRWLNMRVDAENYHLENILVVSRDAMEAQNGKYTVTTLDAERNTHKRGAIVGLRTPQKLWVLQGLEIGDQVVLH